MGKVQNVAIVGAGLGGLTAAIALRQRGFDVTVYEQADRAGRDRRRHPALAQRLARADRARPRQGLRGDRVRAGPPRRAQLEDRQHRLGDADEGRVPSAIRRRLFRRASRRPARRAAAGAAGGMRARSTRAAPASTQTADRAVFTFADGGKAEADVVIGADGIRSAVRASLYRSRHAALHRPHRLARAGPERRAAEGPDRARHDRLVRAEGHGRALLRAARRDRELDRALRDRLARGILVGRERLARGRRGLRRLASDARASSSPAPSAATNGRSTTAIRCRAGRKGRVTLLGDAAHPMLPYLAQGAAQALEDGYVLADMLAQHRSDPLAALQAYEHARLPRTSRIQLHARERGKINNTTSAFQRFAARPRLPAQAADQAEGAHLQDRMDLRPRRDGRRQANVKAA